jgi:type I restriction enzyme S subunit
VTTYSGYDFWRDHEPPWPVVPLRKVARLGTGHTPSRSVDQYWENCTIPWVTTEDLTSRTGTGLEPLLETKQQISELGLANSAAELHPAGTVMLSRTASVGHVARVGVPMTTTQAFVTWTCGSELDPRYLTAVLLAMKPEFFRLAYGSTHLTIYMPDIEQLRVPVPPLVAQRAIADFLDVETARIDALIAKRRRLVQLLDQREAGVAEVAIRALAMEHGEVPLRHFAPGILVGIVVTPAAYYADQGVPALRGINVKRGRLDLANLVHLSPEGDALHRKSRLSAGDVVIVRTGQAGAACIVPPELDGANCVDLLIVHRSRHFVPAYLEFVLNSDWTAKHIAEHSVGTIQSHFNVAALKGLPVPVPPLEVQATVVKGLVAETRQISQVRLTVSQQLELLAEHRQALITAAVTGELDIPGVAA